MSAALDCLRAARETIADPARWTQGTAARDARGWSVSSGNRRARCWCAWGALFKQLGDGNLEGPAAAHLRVAAQELFDRTPAAVNDGLGHAAALRMYDRAIALAEAEAA